MHRSGTSALTRVLSFLGGALPKHVVAANASNPSGHWEPLRLVTIHDELLAACGSGWDDWRELPLDRIDNATRAEFASRIGRAIADDYDALSPILIKDPRICRFVPLYRALLAEAGITPLHILAFRHPLAVAASLQRRDGMIPEFACLLWLRHVLDAEAATRDADRVFVCFDDLVRDWRPAARLLASRITDDGMIPDGADRDIGAFLVLGGPRDEDAFRPTPGASTQAIEWATSAYAALRVLLGSPQDAVSLRTLDRIRGALNDWRSPADDTAFQELLSRRNRLKEMRHALDSVGTTAPVPGPWSVEYENRISEQAGVIAGLTQEMANRSDTISAQEREIATLQREIEAVSADMAAKTVRMEADMALKIVHMEADMAAKTVRMEADMAARIGHMEADVAAKLGHMESELSDLAFRLRSSEAELSRVLRSKSWRLTAPLRTVRARLPVRPLQSARYGVPRPRWYAIYSRLPVPEPTRRFLRSVARRVAPTWHQNTILRLSAATPTGFGSPYSYRCQEPEAGHPPLVSVIIPVYDRTDVLREAIASVLAQTFSSFELILVSDGSPKETLSVLDEFRSDPRIRIFCFPDNTGNAVRGRNKGILEARGKYVSFLDSDDIAHPERLALSVAALEGGECDVVYGSWRALAGWVEVDSRSC